MVIVMCLLDPATVIQVVITMEIAVLMLFLPHVLLHLLMVSDIHYCNIHFRLPLIYNYIAACVQAKTRSFFPFKLILYPPVLNSAESVRNLKKKFMVRVV